MQQLVMVLISATVFALVTILAIRSIRNRKVSQGAQGELGQLKDLAALTGKPVVAARGQYVATVFHERPLERVVTGGLLHRGKAQIVVTTEGVGVERIGEESFAIDAGLMIEISRASATIDRAVETDGLLAISWLLGETAVTTQLRIDESEDSLELNQALQQLVNKDGAR